jgi:hypothetical protein
MAKKRGKLYKAAMEQIDRRAHYPLEEAIKILHESPMRPRRPVRTWWERMSWCRR